MNTRHPSAKYLSALIVLLLVTTTSAADKALLRCRYKTGEKYLASVVNNQEITQQLGVRTNMMKQTMRMEMGLEVLSVDADATADIKVTYRRMALKQEAPMLTLDYDSADPEKKDTAHPALVGLKALVGCSLTMKMTSLGEVKDITGTEDLVKSILEGVPAGPQREAAGKQLSRMMTKEQLSRQMSGFSIRLPEHPVGVGDTWHQDQTMNLGMAKVVVRTTYKVRQLTADTVDIAVDSAIETAGEPDAATVMTINVEKGSKQSGTTKVNRANAAVSNGELTQLMNVAITVPGRTIKQSIAGTATMTVKPDVPR